LGTSGDRTRNASINLSIPDGWVPEFAKHGKNAFLIDTAEDTLTPEAKDKIEAKNLLDVLEHEIIPMYYDNPKKWLSVVKSSMQDVVPYFDAGRMAQQYYNELYS
jgi:starch phosphorylase